MVLRKTPSDHDSLTDYDEGQDGTHGEPPYVLRHGIIHLELYPALKGGLYGGIPLLPQLQLDALLPLLGVEEAEREDDLREPHAEDGADDEEAEAMPQPRQNSDGGDAAEEDGDAEGHRRRAGVHRVGDATEGEHCMGGQIGFNASNGITVHSSKILVEWLL